MPVCSHTWNPPLTGPGFLGGHFSESTKLAGLFVSFKAHPHNKSNPELSEWRLRGGAGLWRGAQRLSEGAQHRDLPDSAVQPEAGKNKQTKAGLGAFNNLMSLPHQIEPL